MLTTKEIENNSIIYKGERALEITNRNFQKFLNEDEGKKARKFHSTIRGYKPTPLVELKSLADVLGVNNIFIKDESHRFGLNAFKVLGASYAMGKLLCKKLGIDITSVDFEYLKSTEVKNKVGKITFIAATDGNHGRAVAWSAKQLGQEVIIYLPKGSSQRRVDAIKEVGAKVYVTELNYDDTVEYVNTLGSSNGWQIIQDTAWDGYEEIPEWILQGYTTMVEEIVEELNLKGISKPTHIFLQAGVGSMAAAVLAQLVNIYKEEYPITVILEPNKANCFFKSMLAKDGEPHAVKGSLETIMAGLACGIPNPITWEILRDYPDAYVSCDDYVSARGIRISANPIGNDPKLICGECGAVGLGMLSIIMQNKEYSQIRTQLNFDQNSKVLIISTEGATDPVNYRNILWDGKFSMPKI